VYCFLPFVTVLGEIKYDKLMHRPRIAESGSEPQQSSRVILGVSVATASGVTYLICTVKPICGRSDIYLMGG